MKLLRAMVVMIVLLATITMAGSAAQAARPVPTATTDLTFSSDCSFAVVYFQWEGFRADTMYVAVHTVSGGQAVAVADHWIYLSRAKRSFGSYAEFQAPSIAPWNGSWAGQSVWGFGAAYSPRGAGLTDDALPPVTCSPVT